MKILVVLISVIIKALATNKREATPHAPILDQYGHHDLHMGYRPVIHNPAEDFHIVTPLRDKVKPSIVNVHDSSYPFYHPTRHNQGVIYPLGHPQEILHPLEQRPRTPNLDAYIEGIVHQADLSQIMLSPIQHSHETLSLVKYDNSLTFPFKYNEIVGYPTENVRNNIHTLRYGHETEHAYKVNHGRGIIHPVEHVHESVHPLEHNHHFIHNTDHSHVNSHIRDHSHVLDHPLILHPIHSNKLSYSPVLPFHRGHVRIDHKLQEGIYNPFTELGNTNRISSVYHSGNIHLHTSPTVRSGNIPPDVLISRNFLTPYRHTNPVAIASHPNGGHSFVKTRRLGKREVGPKADSKPELDSKSEEMTESKKDEENNAPPDQLDSIASKEKPLLIQGSARSFDLNDFSDKDSSNIFNGFDLGLDGLSISLGDKLRISDKGISFGSSTSSESNAKHIGRKISSGLSGNHRFDLPLSLHSGLGGTEALRVGQRQHSTSQQVHTNGQSIRHTSQEKLEAGVKGLTFDHLTGDSHGETQLKTIEQDHEYIFEPNSNHDKDSLILKHHDNTDNTISTKDTHQEPLDLPPIHIIEYLTEPMEQLNHVHGVALPKDTVLHQAHRLGHISEHVVESPRIRNLGITGNHEGSMEYIPHRGTGPVIVHGRGGDSMDHLIIQRPGHATGGRFVISGAMGQVSESHINQGTVHPESHGVGYIVGHVVNPLVGQVERTDLTPLILHEENHRIQPQFHHGENQNKGTTVNLRRGLERPFIDRGIVPVTEHITWPHGLKGDPAITSLYPQSNQFVSHRVPPYDLPNNHISAARSNVDLIADRNLAQGLHHTFIQVPISTEPKIFDLNQISNSAIVHPAPYGGGLHVHTEEHIQDHKTHVFENKYGTGYEVLHSHAPGQTRLVAGNNRRGLAIVNQPVLPNISYRPSFQKVIHPHLLLNKSPYVHK